MESAECSIESEDAGSPNLVALAADRVDSYPGPCGRSDFDFIPPVGVFEGVAQAGGTARGEASLAGRL